MTDHEHDDSIKRPVPEGTAADAYAPPQGPGSRRMLLIVALLVLVALVVFGVLLALR